jgi:hypothetical protein
VPKRAGGEDGGGGIAWGRGKTEEKGGRKGWGKMDGKNEMIGGENGRRINGWTVKCGGWRKKFCGVGEGRGD